MLTDVGTTAIDSAYSVALQADGKIVAAGTSGATTRTDFALVRYTTDGRLDTSYGSGGKVLTDLATKAPTTGPTRSRSSRMGRSSPLANGGRASDFALVRYMTSGEPDTSFGPGGKVLTDVSGATTRHLRSRSSRTGRSLPPGTPGLSTSHSSATRPAGSSIRASQGWARADCLGSDERRGVWVTTVAFQTDGKIVAAGRSGRDFALARYTTRGKLDAGFGRGGKVRTAFGGDGDARGGRGPAGRKDRRHRRERRGLHARPLRELT